MKELQCVSEDLQMLLGITGLEVFLKICKTFEGTSIYFSKSISKELERESILKDYQNSQITYKELARKYNYSETYIREICNNLFSSFSKEDKSLFS